MSGKRSEKDELDRFLDDQPEIQFFEVLFTAMSGVPRGKRLRRHEMRAVYDDGRFTYVRMSDLKSIPTGNFPAVFARERENSDDLVVNSTVEGNTIIVHGTYPYLVIRHGKNVVGLRRNSRK